MKTTNFNYIYTLVKGSIILLISVLLSACNDDSPIPGIAKENNGDVSVQLTIHTPKEYKETKTKSQTEDEAAIQSIQLLVFQKGLFKYARKGNIEPSGSNLFSTTFSATLSSTTDSVKLYIIANVPDVVAEYGIESNDTEENVKSKLVMDFTTSGIGGYFPMYGEYYLPEGIDATISNKYIGIKMLRAIARIDVMKNSDVNNFALLSIQAFRASNKIQLAPDSFDTANPVVTVPSIAQGTSRDISTPQLQVVDHASMSQLYLPESWSTTAESEMTCVVIGGKFGADQEMSYYRIDFNSGKSGHPQGQILRNHRYIFNIKTVSKRGEPSAEAAANSGASGMEVEVTNWDENLTYMVFEGAEFFSISSRNVDLLYFSGETTLLDIESSFDDYTIQWSNAAGILDPTNTDLREIENDDFRVELVTEDSKPKLKVTALGTNNTNSPKKQYCTIIAKNWRIVIEITQLQKPDFSDQYIKVLSISDSYGGLGGYNLYSYGSSEGTSGIRQIVRNKDNFGPTGTVRIAGFIFDYFPSSAYLRTYNGNAQTNLEMLLDGYDIIIIPYNENPDLAETELIVNWLKKPHKVLFISHDTGSVGANILTRLGTLGMWGGGGGTTEAGIAEINDDNACFLSTGPFGSATNAVFKGDGTWLAIKKNEAGTLTPLLTYTKGADEYYMTAVDKVNRIVYSGESEHYTTGRSNLNTSGATDYDNARLLANIYAWAIEEVILPGRIK